MLMFPADPAAHERDWKIQAKSISFPFPQALSLMQAHGSGERREKDKNWVYHL